MAFVGLLIDVIDLGKEHNRNISYVWTHITCTLGVSIHLILGELFFDVVQETSKGFRVSDAKRVPIKLFLLYADFKKITQLHVSY